MPEHYVYVVSEEFDQELLEILLKRGITLEWWEPIFGLVGGSVPSDEAAEINSSVHNIEWIRAVEEERRSSTEAVTAEDTERLVVEPKFDPQEFGLNQAHEYVEEQSAGPSEFTVRTAVIDSGIDSRNDRIETVSERINFTDEDDLDSVGHGTFVASILEYTVGPLNQELIDMKVATRSGTREGAVVRALRACVQRGVHQANLSLGFSDHDDRDVCPVCTAAEIVASRGVVVTAAAGNHGRVDDSLPTPECPARSEAVIAAGALQDENTLRYSSGMGDVFSPSSWKMYEPRDGE